MKPKVAVKSLSPVNLVSSVMATFRPDGEGRMPVLCEADEQTCMAWRHGERAAKQTLIDAFCEKFRNEARSFDEEAFREACRWRMT